MDDERLRAFVATRPATPCAVFDPAIAVAAYDRCAAVLGGGGRLQFAVKARPEPRLLAALVERGAGMDVGSPAEVDAALAAGCPPGRLSYGNVFAGEDEVAYACEGGVRTFCGDTVEFVERLARLSPGARFFVRLAHGGSSAAIPLAGRFGCPPGQAVDLALHAAGRGLDVAGLTWHVGSQQTDPAQWEVAAEAAAGVWSAASRAGLRTLRALNVGGGLPARYRTPVPTLEQDVETIRAVVGRHFGRPLPALVLEPGRALVANAGVTLATVKAVVERPAGTFVVLDVGIWNAGLIENKLSAIDYPISALDHPADAPRRPVVVCGPTCDSLDALDPNGEPYLLPAALAAGDRVAIWFTGAYCATNTAVAFNGYAPIPRHVL